ncbi:hypothetical protein FRC05_007401 [Tulasnella sp. 425]|nr:hypothetical protein FRC05_007401 [Tulasnella sp. 425]
MPASTQNLNSQQPQDSPATSTGADGAQATQPDDPDASRVPSIREGAEGSIAEPAEDSAEPTQVPATPKVSITLLLVSGRRRTVEFEKQTTVGELKEIVWSTWPGALNLAEPPDATVMHVSVRSFAPTSNEDLKKPKKRGSRRGRSSSAADGAAATGVRGDDDEDDGAGGCCSGCVIC